MLSFPKFHGAKPCSHLQICAMLHPGESEWLSESQGFQDWQLVNEQLWSHENPYGFNEDLHATSTRPSRELSFSLYSKYLDLVLLIWLSRETDHWFQWEWDLISNPACVNYEMNSSRSWLDVAFLCFSYSATQAASVFTSGILICKHF